MRSKMESNREPAGRSPHRPNRQWFVCGQELDLPSAVVQIVGMLMRAKTARASTDKGWNAGSHDWKNTMKYSPLFMIVAMAWTIPAQAQDLDYFKTAEIGSLTPSDPKHEFYC